MYESLAPGAKPPLLDCTMDGGLNAKTIRAAQVAWAKYLNEPGHEKAMYLDADKKIAIEMVLIPPGKYYRGSVAGIGSDDERPQAVITLDQPRWVGKYEVTQKQYQAVMGKNPSSFKKEGEDAVVLPVENVSHDDSVQFARKATEATGTQFRLLTESEWEYSARAGTRTKWYNGDDEKSVSEIAEFEKNNNEATAKVGGKKSKANAFGLYDMSGNVWEWCGDWYADKYDNTTTTNSQGPTMGSLRVYRGGSWSDAADYCRSAYRSRSTPGHRHDGLGFRVSAGPSGLN